MVYLPVMSTARLGAQVTAPVYQRRKIVPCFAKRLRLGVRHSFRPLKPTSLHPRSSARIITRFGRGAGSPPRLSVGIAQEKIRNTKKTFPMRPLRATLFSESDEPQA